MRVLVVNAGSSSLKLSVLDGDDARRAVDTDDLDAFVASVDGIDAVGHRVVHGGTEFTDAVVVDDDVIRRLGALSPLAPLHQPRALQLIREARDLLPGIPHVACFDTAFHATIPAAAATYALPKEWRDTWPLRRFGFHGLSHAYASRTAAARLGRAPEDLALVTAHLGAGASLCAVRGGRSVDTTMGMTPLEGLVMATRAGSIDPGLVLWVQQYGGLALGPVQHALEEESGLKGLAGTGDMREVLRRRAEGRRRRHARVRRLHPPAPARDRRDDRERGRPHRRDRLHRRRRRARARGARRRDRRPRGRRGPRHRSPRRHRDRAARAQPVQVRRRSARACVMTSPGITRSRHGVSRIATNDSAVGLVHTGIIDGS